LDHAASLPYFLEKVMPAHLRDSCCVVVVVVLFGAEICRLISADYVQGPGVYDPRHKGYLQAAALGLCQSQQSVRGGYAV